MPFCGFWRTWFGTSAPVQPVPVAPALSTVPVPVGAAIPVQGALAAGEASGDNGEQADDAAEDLESFMAGIAPFPEASGVPDGLAGADEETLPEVVEDPVSQFFSETYDDGQWKEAVAYPQLMRVHECPGEIICRGYRLHIKPDVSGFVFFTHMASAARRVGKKAALQRDKQANGGYKIHVAIGERDFDRGVLLACEVLMAAHAAHWKVVVGKRRAEFASSKPREQGKQITIFTFRDRQSGDFSFERLCPGFAQRVSETMDRLRKACPTDLGPAQAVSVMREGLADQCRVLRQEAGALVEVEQTMALALCEELEFQRRRLIDRLERMQERTRIDVPVEILATLPRLAHAVLAASYIAAERQFWDQVVQDLNRKLREAGIERAPLPLITDWPIGDPDTTYCCIRHDGDHYHPGREPPTSEDEAEGLRHFQADCPVSEVRWDVPQEVLRPAIPGLGVAAGAGGSA